MTIKNAIFIVVNMSIEYRQRKMSKGTLKVFIKKEAILKISLEKKQEKFWYFSWYHQKNNRSGTEFLMNRFLYFDYNLSFNLESFYSTIDVILYYTRKAKAASGRLFKRPRAFRLWPLLSLTILLLLLLQGLVELKGFNGS